MKHHVQESRLSGGASGLLIDVPGVDVVSIQVRFNSGFQFADPRRYEVPHVLEHMLSSATQKHPGLNEFMVEASKNGASVNAFTSVDNNGYVYECADFELDRILGLLEEQLAGPMLVRPALTTELGNVREELARNSTQHATVCSVKLMEASFSGMWLDFDKRIEQLPKIRLDSIRDYFARTHTSANARFCVAGKLEGGADKVAKRLERIFRQLDEGERLERSREIGHGLDRPIVTSRDIQQLYYRVAMFFGELTAAERRALTLLRLVLVGGMGSRIYGEARRRGLAYSVGGAGHAEPGNSSFGFLGYVTPGNAEALFELIGRGYAEVAAGNLTDTELDQAKTLGIGYIKRATQTAGDILSWYMDPYDESGEIRDFDHNLQLLEEVPVEEVVAVAAKATNGGRHAVSFLGSADTELAHKYQRLLAQMWR